MTWYLFSRNSQSDGKLDFNLNSDQQYSQGINTLKRRREKGYIPLKVEGMPS